MTQKKSLVTKSILYVVGLGIIALIWFLRTKGKKIRSEEIFLWSNSAVLYSMLLCPVMFESIPFKTENKKRSLPMVWLGALVFIVIGAGISIVVALKIFQIRIAIVVEVVLAGLFGIDSYLCYFAPIHFPEEDKQEDEQAFALIKQIRISMQTLTLKASSLNAAYVVEKSQLYSFSEAVDSLSAVEDIAAVKMEQDILAKLTAVSSACDSVLAGGDGTEFKKQIASLEVLIKQRSALKN